MLLAGIRRALGVKPNRKAPITDKAIRTMLHQIPRSAAGLRDKALLLMGLAGAFRRSELVALTAADL